MPTAADYFTNAGRGLGELSDALYTIQDRKEKDLEKRNDLARQGAMADPLIRKSIERIINGEDPEQVAHEHLIEQHLSSQQTSAPDTSTQRMPAAGPWKSGYDNGPDQSAMIPYSQPATGSRLPKGPMLDTSSLAIGQDPGIQNQDVPTLMKLGGMIQDERRNTALSNYRDANLGLGYDKLDLARDKMNAGDEYKRAMTDYLNAKRANMPQEMANAAMRINQAEQRLGISREQLGLAGRRLGVQESQAYDKMVGETVWTVPALDNLISKVRTVPGVAPPESDYTMRRAAEIAGALPFGIGGPGKNLLNRVADINLSQQQRDFRRQVSLALQPFRKLNVGTQITAGEFELINELAGQQLSIEDTIAGLAALRQSMNSKLQRAGAFYPGAASKVPQMRPGEVLPPLSSGQTNDPYGLGQLSETPENNYFNQFGYQGNQ